ncbi:MAG: PLP-dependent transferase [Oscillospiraceae bacterium]|nr:PLP-dependent transferase [Oscillospiraceae bacterium]
MKIETACLHAVRDHTTNTGAVALPIYQSATFAHPGVGKSTGYDYSRSQNPTREHCEKMVAALEGGCGGLGFSSGMAAIACLMDLFSPGDEIVATADLYGGTIRLFNHISAKNGLVIKYADTSDLTTLEGVLTEKTRAVFIETPTNPMMGLTDIAAVKRLLKSPDTLLIADNTFLTPILSRPIALGADIVVHSGTKYLAGHNDTLAGFLVAAAPEQEDKLRFLQKTSGAVLSPFDSFLVVRGIKTLALRMAHSCKSAAVIAAWLQTQPWVTRVYYPGMGAMLSFTVTSEETAKQLLEGVEIIQYAESLGGVESLLTYPFTQTHADVPVAERIARGIDERLLRLSVGIEDAQDLIADLACAADSDTACRKENLYVQL